MSGYGGLDQVLMSLSSKWKLELQVDPACSQDDRGRILGHTLWFVLAKVRRRDSGQLGEATMWVTADCMDEAYHLAELCFIEDPLYRLIQVQSADRMAFDERPSQLVDVPINLQHSVIHSVRIEPQVTGLCRSTRTERQSSS